MDTPHKTTVPPSAGYHHRLFILTAERLAEKEGISLSEAFRKTVADKPELRANYLKEEGAITAETATILSEGGAK